MLRSLRVITKIFAIVAILSAPLAEASEQLQVRGSDTMVNLIQRIAEVYMEKNPGKNVVVTGGGSGTGIAGLRNRTVDIADSSRPIRGREKIDLKAKGVNPLRIVVARDCITIIVNQSNKVEALTFDQLGAIFRGDVTNWKDVGGADMPITLYGRQSNSGTFDLFRRRVLKSDYSDKMRRLNGNSQIIESVKSDKSGIGYVGVGHAKHATGIAVVKIAEDENAEYIDPTKLSSVDAEKYPISRPLLQYTNGNPEGRSKDFILFELGAEGQKICEEMGFFALSEKDEQKNAAVLGM